MVNLVLKIILANFWKQKTVYPQKQQSYGPYGYAAYPGPAAYYGSQYGLPYNQY